jgi:protein O-GlcNAc transferase
MNFEEKEQSLKLAEFYFRDNNYSFAQHILDKVIKIDPNNSKANELLSYLYENLGKFDLSFECLRVACSQSNCSPEALYYFGSAQLKEGLFDQAIESFEKSMSRGGEFFEALHDLATAQGLIGELTLALNNYQKCLKFGIPSYELFFNIARIYDDLKHFDEAITHYDKALTLKPDFAEGWSNKGVTLHELKRHDEAIAHYDKALGLKPDYAEGWSNKGNTLNELKRFGEAMAHYDKALSLKPDYAKGWSNKGLTMNELKMHSESAQCFHKALKFNVEDSYLLGQAHHQMMLGCDWSDYEKIINEIFHLAKEGRKGAEPFGFQGIASSEELLKKCAEIYSNDCFPLLDNLPKFLKYNHHKIRIGYLCGEFRNQATSILMTRVWELHDKSKFEIFAFDNGWDDGSEYRQRIVGAFSNVFDISRLSDLDAAKLIQLNEIDILVNLNGFFGLGRQRIFSYKPAPIQVNYLGFPGTMGIKYMDYIIADKVVIPEESKIYYAEKLVYLPNSYQANDDMRKIADRKFSKVELGLPKDAFVFACFNNNYKITPTIFDSWMRILSLVEGSVLWLLADNPTAKDNLIKEALARGIDSSRLVFAERLPISEHLARHDLADLFLDTLPYNAHTTCSDALWAGLPVLTLMGHTFPGRVSSSLLSAIGLSELVTHTQEEYEALAIELALDSKKLADIQLKLARNRLTTPLFDTPLFTKNLETAYIKMVERYQADLEPGHITIN